MPGCKTTEFAASRRFRFNKMKVASNDVGKGKVMSGTHWHSTQQHPPLIRLVQKPRVILPSAQTNFFFSSTTWNHCVLLSVEISREKKSGIRQSRKGNESFSCDTLGLRYPFCYLSEFFLYGCNCRVQANLLGRRQVKKCSSSGFLSHHILPQALYLKTTVEKNIKHIPPPLPPGEWVGKGRDEYQVHTLRHCIKLV